MGNTLEIEVRQRVRKDLTVTIAKRQEREEPFLPVIMNRFSKKLILNFKGETL